MSLLIPIIFGSIAIALVAIGVPLARGRIPRNPIFGLRTGETLGDDEVWYVANRMAGRDLAAFGIGLAGWSVANVWWHPLGDPLMDLLLATAILVLGISLASMRGVLFGFRAKRPRNGKSGAEGS